jgi:hypothetical protein
MQRGRVRRLGDGLELRDGGVDRLQHTVERLLHRLQRERGRAQPDLFVLVLEDERVFPVDVAAARLSEADVVPHHRLQLERDVLDDVRRVRAASQPENEPAALADRAAVLHQPRHRADEALREARHVGR